MTIRELGLGLAAIVFPPHCAVCEEPAATALRARALARRVELAVEVAGLRRTRYTVPQTALTPAERRLLMEEVPFEATEPARVAGRRVLVIDDVSRTQQSRRSDARASALPVALAA